MAAGIQQPFMTAATPEEQAAKGMQAMLDKHTSMVMILQDQLKKTEEELKQKTKDLDEATEQRNEEASADRAVEQGLRKELANANSKMALNEAKHLLMIRELEATLEDGTTAFDDLMKRNEAKRIKISQLESKLWNLEADLREAKDAVKLAEASTLGVRFWQKQAQETREYWQAELPRQLTDLQNSLEESHKVCALKAARSNKKAIEWLRSEEKAKNEEWLQVVLAARGFACHSQAHLDALQTAIFEKFGGYYTFSPAEKLKIRENIDHLMHFGYGYKHPGGLAANKPAPIGETPEEEAAHQGNLSQEDL